MSGVNEAVDTRCCASCGIVEIEIADNIKLVPCDDCDLVKYCSDACRELHRPEHAGKCRKRAAKLRDELLFKQPESTHLGDCPICSLPLSLDASKFSMMACCSKMICFGCEYANRMREIEMRLQHSCPFCRESAIMTDEERKKLVMKRIEANDPNAMRFEGAGQYENGEYQTAFEYFTKAAKLGNASSHYSLSIMYRLGHGVEKDEGKEIYHLEEAAIGGHPHARYGLGIHEGGGSNYERAVKHWIIAATQGDNESIKMLMDFFKLQEEEFVSKEQLDAALRAHKAAVDATKSPQRKTAEEYKKGLRGS